MYGHNNSFSQSPRYGDLSHYTPYYPTQTCDWYVRDPRQCRPIGDVIAPEDATNVALKEREKNRQIILDFIDQCDNNERERSNQGVKISEARNDLMQGYRMIQRLETMREKLKKNENLDDDKWTQEIREISSIRNEIGRLFEKYRNIDRLVGILRKRGNKRKREMRKRAAWRERKILSNERRARREAKIDAWIREKSDEIERDKQVENLRKDADIVLADVRGKRNDAKKYLALLQELKNLRRVKVGVARARGENLPTAGDQAFDNIIGQLVEQWECLDREYSIEEQGLKLMLKTDNEKKIEKQKSNTYDDWEMALFGAKLRSNDPRRGDIHRLVTIRCAWDKYVNFEGQGSRVPIGWIMPVQPSSAAWQKFIKRE